MKLALPATSANLGPGFDAVGLAVSMHLRVEAERAAQWQIVASGRDTALVGAVEGNLLVETFRSVMEETGLPVTPLKLTIHNEIPLGMGCGSSAAALLAGVALAAHFGPVALGDAGIVAEAAAREGHPDNVAACWYGGFTVSTLSEETGLEAATFAGNPEWRLLLVMQAASLATKTARALLPETYSKVDAVFNVQRSALLVAAFAQGRLDLLQTAMQDLLHQPYRMDACPLLKALLPMQGEPGIAGVALSGAGPSVLIILAENADDAQVKRRVRELAGPVELVPLRIAGGASCTWE